ncbi:MAG: hypothetical protein JXB04_00295, partial [Kiritimatiellae bacterium]|nr:hypothetical protein [Kiritimatiellia bacterium]
MIRLKLEIGNWSGDLTQNGKVGGPCRGRALPNFTFRISNFKSRSAFTLIELLLVAFIMLLASAMAVPTFIRSYRSAKLRMSARTVVMTSRYARAMAVLQQKYVAVLFDRESGLVEMVGLDEQTGAADRNRFLDERSQPRADTPVEPEEGATFTVSSQVARRVA